MKNIKLNYAYLTLFSLCLAWSVQAQKPNIVVILTDDQGYADIDIDMAGFQSEAESYVRTPHMKALAESGWFFKNAYTSGNICAPTRAGLMTGRYQHRSGIFNGGDGDPNMPSDFGDNEINELSWLPRYLEGDYITAAFGKWHGGECRLEQDPVARGFGDYIGYFEKGGHDYWMLTEDEYNEDTVENYDPDKQYNTMMRGQEFIQVDDSDYPNSLKNRDEGVYMTELLTYEAIQFIKDNATIDPNDKPFFCYLAYTALHSPSQAPIEEKTAFINQFGSITEWGTSAENKERETLMAMLNVLDDGIGEIIQELKDQGVYDDTLLIFLTDNGGDKGMQADRGSLEGRKQYNYQGGIKTPFILSWPNQYPVNGNNQDKGIVIDTQIMSFDILPTLLDAANITPPNTIDFDGKSILPLLSKNGSVPDANHHPTLYWSEGAEKFERFLIGTEPPLGEFAIIDNNWKIYSEVNGNGQVGLELYNLSNDPNEKNNLYNANKETIALDLLKKYETWLAEQPQPLRAFNAKSYYPPITNADIVEVYDDVYFKGTKEGIRNPGKYNTSQLPFGNNDIRSIVVKRGYVATLYSDDNQSGDKLIVRGEGRPLFLNNLDKRVSSIEIQKGYGGECDGEIKTLTYSGDDGSSKRDPVRLIDHDYSSSKGRFLPAGSGTATVDFEFCQSQMIYGLGVMFKNLGCDYKQTVDISLSNNGGNSWTKVVNNGENVIPTEREVVFTFNPQNATDMRLEFQGNEGGSNKRVEILEVDIKYGSESLSNGNPVRASSNALNFWQNSETFHIQSSSSIKSFDLISLKGQVVLRNKNIHAPKTSINTSTLTGGVYIFKVVTSDNVVSYKKVFIK